MQPEAGSQADMFGCRVGVMLSRREIARAAPSSVRHAGTSASASEQRVADAELSCAAACACSVGVVAWPWYAAPRMATHREANGIHEAAV